MSKPSTQRPGRRAVRIAQTAKSKFKKESWQQPWCSWCNGYHEFVDCPYNDGVRDLVTEDKEA